ncbi:MAG: hypothetical protein LBV54_08340 [Puniceicoccales bacterium]|jgi:MSHA type pilus biogenesis protein MshL|nr:hypothetical protein [Puniceicoccales bacterium]
MNLAQKISSAALLTALACAPLFGQTRPVLEGATVPVEEVLMRVVPYFRHDKQPIAQVLQTLGRSLGVTIICDSNVEAEVNFECYNNSLEQLLNAVCQSEGFFWTVENGYIWVHRFSDKTYMIEFSQVEREMTSSSSVRLGTAASSSGFTGGSSGSSSSGSSGGGGSGGNTDETTVSLKSTNKGEFWKGVTEVLESFKEKDEKIKVDARSGTVIVSASRRTHERVRDFVRTLNTRVAQQVEIQVKIVEVTLNDQNKMGVDWSLVRSASWGDLIFRPDSLAGSGPSGTASSFGSNTNINAMHATDLAADTFVSTFGIGKIGIVVRALSQQGSLNTVTAPRVVVAHNQTAYIKDTEDRPFFQLTSSTKGTEINSGTSIVDSKQYSVETISIGTIVNVTPHIADNGDITLDIIPALTRLKEVLTSPGGDSNAPALDVKQMTTVVRLRSGETAVVGGIITDTEATQTRGVPVLKDIPWVGPLFRTDAKYKQKTELVIFLTPSLLIPGGSLGVEGRREAARDSREVRTNKLKDREVFDDESIRAESKVESISIF